MDGKNKVLHFSNRDCYEGDFIEDDSNKKGVYHFPKGGFYEGDLVSGIPNGKGIQHFSDGGRYEGDFVNGLRRGKGTLHYSDGGRYEGDFVDDLFNGKGTLYYSDRIRYEGDFVEGRFNGKGTLYYSDRIRYEGDFVEGRFSGKGTLYYSDGNRYEGDFVNGLRRGKGTLYYSDGNRYEGDFVDDLFNGKGTLYYSDGDLYEGDFVDNKFNGKGTFYYSDGSRYEGDFVDNKFNGKGTFYYSDGDLYEGDFVDNKFNGKGTLYYSDGDLYEGDFVDDLFNGKGTLYYSDGDLYEGDFVDNKFNGKGTLYYSDGDLYEGDFVDNKFNGKGTLYYSDGDLYEGDFVDGVFDDKNASNRSGGGSHKDNLGNEEHNGDGAFQNPIRNDSDIDNSVNIKMDGKKIVSPSNVHSGTQYVFHSKPFASGGEGELYQIISGGVKGSGELVAKIFKDHVDINEKEKKMEAMLRNRPNDPYQELAWPIEGLYQNGRFIGYIMGKAESSESLSALYEYGKYSKFSDRPLSSKIQVAMNICSALNNVHEAGHVCGDLNPNNISIHAERGIVKFLDTDSYHINDGDVLYRCKVGMPDYVAPELQKKFKDGLDRAQLPTFTKSTDNFALAVHIFQLLMNGVHPFSCASSESENSSLSENIIKRRFVFHTPHEGYTTPAMAPEFTSLPQSIRELFIRSFVDSDVEKRATPVEWFRELKSFKNSLKTCDKVKSHQFYNKLNACPLCEADRRFNAIRISPNSNYNNNKNANVIFQTPAWTSQGRVTQNTVTPTQRVSAKRTATPPQNQTNVYATNTHSGKSKVPTLQNSYTKFKNSLEIYGKRAYAVIARTQTYRPWQPKLNEKEALKAWLLALLTIIPAIIHSSFTNGSDSFNFIFYVAGIITFTVLFFLFGSINGKLAQILTGTIFILSSLIWDSDPAMIWIVIGSFLLLVGLSRWCSRDQLSLAWAIGLSTGFIVIPVDIIWQTGSLLFFYAIGFVCMIILNEFSPKTKYGMTFVLNIISGIFMLTLAFISSLALVPLIANVILCILYVYYST